MSYQKVADAIQEHNLSWSDIDRILLKEDTYEDFIERASFDPSNYSTDDTPAVRRTPGTEKIVYVNDKGIQLTIEL